LVLHWTYRVGLAADGGTDALGFHVSHTTVQGAGLVKEEREIWIPCWAVATAAAAGLAWQARVIHRERRLTRRLAANLCPACGYDLRATPGRCPECGVTSVRASHG
jgi:hypothetical protein